MNTSVSYACLARSTLHIFILLTFSQCQVMASSSGVEEPSYSNQYEPASTKHETPQALFDYAQKAIQSSNYRAAINALEKILHQNPKLANIRLELGVLYKRVGNYDLAERYINEALLAPGIPENVKARAQSLLQQTEDINSPHSLLSNLSIKTIYDSNANAGPSDSSVTLSGAEFELSEDTLGEPDSSLEVVGTLQYNYDIEGTKGTRVETGLLSYNRFYNTFSRLDTNVLDANVGVRFNLNETNSVKPYLSFNGIYLGQDAYKTGKALGINYRALIDQNSLLELDTFIESQEHTNSSEHPQASLRDGSSRKMNGKISRQITPFIRAYGKVGLSHRSSEADFESFDELSTGIGMHYKHKGNPQQEKSATTSLSIDWRNISYSEADSQAGFEKPRNESRTIIRLDNSKPITNNFLFSTSISYTNNESEITLYDYDNWSGNVGFSFSTY